MGYRERDCEAGSLWKDKKESEVRLQPMRFHQRIWDTFTSFFRGLATWQLGARQGPFLAAFG